MPQWHGDQKKRKTTGGKRRASRTKRRYESGRDTAETQVGERALRIVNAKGKTTKPRLLSAKLANVTVPRERKTEKVEILRVVRNPVSADYDRRRVITRGAVIATRLGEAIVTSRPGQDGIVNALLLESRA